MSIEVCENLTGSIYHRLEAEDKKSAGSCYVNKISGDKIYLKGSSSRPVVIDRGTGKILSKNQLRNFQKSYELEQNLAKILGETYVDFYKLSESKNLLLSEIITSIKNPELDQTLNYGERLGSTINEALRIKNNSKKNLGCYKIKFQYISKNHLGSTPLDLISKKYGLVQEQNYYWVSTNKKQEFLEFLADSCKDFAIYKILTS